MLLVLIGLYKYCESFAIILSVVYYCTMEEILKEHGHFLTKPRLAVLKVLKKQHTPLNSQGIHKQLKGAVDLASVYRTLKLFTELNIVQEEKVDKESYYYLAVEHHHHITCRECGTVQCTSCRMSTIRVKNFSNVNHQLTLTGICNNCS